MNFAVGFTAYDSVEEPILDKSIGELTFNAYEWGIGDDGKYFVRYVPLPSHTCTEEELSLVNGPNTTFLPINSESMIEVTTYRKKMLCIDPEEMYIYGDYSSSKARLLDIKLVRCHGHDYCASDEEITAFLRDKFIVLLYNQILFDANEYNENSVLEQSLLQWIPVNTQV